MSAARIAIRRDAPAHDRQFGAFPAGYGRSRTEPMIFSGSGWKLGPDASRSGSVGRHPYQICSG
jgi:hypothetical protein